MNSSFNAFQLNQMPEMSHSNRKHIRLKKSMTLPDDTLEYWGFYLLRGSTVDLRACSLFEGSRILVVKGERNLRTCGLLDHNLDKLDPHMAQGQGKVVVTFEEATVVDDAENSNTTYPDQNDDPDAYGGNGGEVMDDSDVVKRPPKQPNYLDQTNDLGSRSRNENDDEEVEALRAHHTTAEPLTTQAHRARHNHHHHPFHLIPDVDDETKDHKKASEDAFKKHLHQHHPKETNAKERARRDTVLDRGLTHGGSAVNYTEKPSDSVSSFENSLLTCYDGQILLAQYFPPSNACHNIKFLENTTRQGQKTMATKHEVVSDGYYYYIFYSDNDLVKNDIHAIFDIYKPTYQYANISESKGCVNATSCSFPIRMLSDERVIVEVPTRDGIEHEDDDITQLVSICVPRSSVYAVFPILVLLFILSFAFL